MSGPEYFGCCPSSHPLERRYWPQYSGDHEWYVPFPRQPEATQDHYGEDGGSRRVSTSARFTPRFCRLTRGLFYLHHQRSGLCVTVKDAPPCRTPLPLQDYFLGSVSLQADPANRARSNTRQRRHRCPLSRSSPEFRALQLRIRHTAVDRFLLLQPSTGQAFQG